MNSGSARGAKDPEESAYKVNLAAAAEIARQLRLRDLGGVIVNDFIDMRAERHKRGLLRAFEQHLDRDRARTKVSRPSEFGLVEMTRQRIRPSLGRAMFNDCPCCSGTGQVKTAESMSIEVMRAMMAAADVKHVAEITVSVHEAVADDLNNRKRREIMTAGGRTGRPHRRSPARRTRTRSSSPSHAVRRQRPGRQKPAPAAFPRREVTA